MTHIFTQHGNDNVLLPLWKEIAAKEEPDATNLARIAVEFNQLKQKLIQQLTAKLSQAKGEDDQSSKNRKDKIIAQEQSLSFIFRGQVSGQIDA